MSLVNLPAAGYYMALFVCLFICLCSMECGLLPDPEGHLCGGHVSSVVSMKFIRHTEYYIYTLINVIV